MLIFLRKLLKYSEGALEKMKVMKSLRKLFCARRKPRNVNLDLVPEGSCRSSGMDHFVVKYRCSTVLVFINAFLLSVTV